MTPQSKKVDCHPKPAEAGEGSAFLQINKLSTGNRVSSRPAPILLRPSLFVRAQSSLRLFRLLPRPHLRSRSPNLDRSVKYRAHRKTSPQFVPPPPPQAHRSHASARSAIRLPAKLARCNFRRQIRRQRPSRLRKNAILRRLWRRSELPNPRLRHIQLRILFPQLEHVRNRLRALSRRQHLRQIIPNLRREQTEPHFLDLWPRRPKLQKLLQISRALHHLARHRAMQRHILPRDILKNALISSGRPPRIMFRLQAINRNGHVQQRHVRPTRAQRAKSAGYHLHVNPARK